MELKLIRRWMVWRSHCGHFLWKFYHALHSYTGRIHFLVKIKLYTSFDYLHLIKAVQYKHFWWHYWLAHEQKHETRPIVKLNHLMSLSICLNWIKVVTLTMNNIREWKISIFMFVLPSSYDRKNVMGFFFWMLTILNCYMIEWKSAFQRA